MKEIALHILDIAMNAVAAGARHIAILVNEDAQADRLHVRITDDGKGMDEQTLHEALERFGTDKQERRRRIALGLALLRQTAETCGGGIRVVSQPRRGTEVDAWMQYGHIDRPPVGNLEDTVFALSVGAPEVDVEFTYSSNGALVRFDSVSVRRALGPGASLQSPEGLRAVRRAMRDVTCTV